MATTSKVFARQGLITSTSTYYTVPSATTAIVTNIVVSNTSSSARTFTIFFGGVAFASAVSIAANSVAIFDLKQVLNATTVITASASANDEVMLHISGVEVTA